MVSANKTQTQSHGTRRCFNCGSPEHIRPDCPKDPSKCNFCGDTGHIETFCLAKKSAAYKKEDQVKKEPSKDQDFRRQVTKRTGKPSKPPTRRQKVLQKVLARMAEAMLQDDDEDDPDNNEDEVNEDMYSDEDENIAYMMTLKKHVLALAAKEGQDTEIILDTGCNGAHVLQKEASSLVSDTRPSNKSVQGIGGVLQSESRGKLGNMGKALVVPKMEASLLSVMELVTNTGGSFHGDTQSMEILDSDGKVILTGHNRGDGFWKCTIEDVRQVACLLGNAADDDPDDPDEPDALINTQVEEPTIPTTVHVQHLTSQERQRATTARELCSRLSHPGTSALIRALDNGNYPDTNITSQDVRNAITLFGPCTACIEGKMKSDPTPKQSINPPAPTIGHTLHVDLIPLSKVSIGGNRFILFSVDEKSGFIKLVSLPSKNTPAICGALDSIVGVYASLGHRVQLIQHDHESNFIHCTTHVNLVLKAEMKSVAAAHHEKMAERNIQTLRARQRSLLAGSKYEMNPHLEAESFHAAAHGMNITPRKRS